ncbi:DNA-directed RNA polymerase subunit delta [Peptococcaceae bacterium CEB3]|nr:DNA-directed RNA polymerase subunit delta [Peptococcaceae bacterium CEB3]
MAQSFGQGRLSSSTDIAFELLKTHGRPMNYRDLIGLILQKKELPQSPEQVSAVLTQINLDTRFAYAGSGEWGLKVWLPTRTSKRMPSITLMNKSVAYDDEDTAKTSPPDGEDPENGEHRYEGQEDPGEAGDALDDEDEDEDEDKDEEDMAEGDEEEEDGGGRKGRW